MYCSTTLIPLLQMLVEMYSIILEDTTDYKTGWEQHIVLFKKILIKESCMVKPFVSSSPPQWTVNHFILNVKYRLKQTHWNKEMQCWKWNSKQEIKIPEGELSRTSALICLSERLWNGVYSHHHHHMWRTINIHHHVGLCHWKRILTNHCRTEIHTHTNKQTITHTYTYTAMHVF